MRYRTLGWSGLVVSELALGTMLFGEDSPRSTGPEEARRIVDAFLEAGGTHIDTADVYAGGRSEEILGEVLRGRREQVVLATKVRFATGPGHNDAGLSRRHVRLGVEASLRRLGTDWLDLLYLHTWDPLTPIEETLAACDDLVRQGTVHYLGVSNFAAWQMVQALGLADTAGWARFVAAQYQYHLLTRDVEWEVLPACLDQGVGLVPWSPLAGGWLTGKYRRGGRPTEGRVATQPDHDEEAWVRRDREHTWEVLEALEGVAAGAGVTPSQAALAWLASRPGVDSIVLGPRTVEQLEEGLGAAGLDLGEDALAALEAASAVPAPYPQRFLEGYGRREL